MKPAAIVRGVRLRMIGVPSLATWDSRDRAQVRRNPVQKVRNDFDARRLPAALFGW